MEGNVPKRISDLDLPEQESRETEKAVGNRSLKGSMGKD